MYLPASLTTLVSIFFAGFVMGSGSFHPGEVPPPPFVIALLVVANILAAIAGCQGMTGKLVKHDHEWFWRLKEKRDED